jgi:hypothetical protein
MHQVSSAPYPLTFTSVNGFGQYMKKRGGDDYHSYPSVETDGKGYRIKKIPAFINVAEKAGINFNYQ